MDPSKFEQVRVATSGPFFYLSGSYGEIDLENKPTTSYNGVGGFMKTTVETSEMYNYYISENISLEKAAERFGIRASSLRKRFIKDGFKCKTRNQTRGVSIDFEELTKLYVLENKSIDELAKHFNISRGSIWNRLKELKINKSPEEAKSLRSDNYVLWTEKLTNEVKESLLETRSIKLTADIFGLSANSISEKNLHEWYINIQWTKNEKENIKKRLEETKSYTIVAKEFNTTEQSISCLNWSNWKIDLSENSNLFGTPTIAKDGNKYRSKIEAEVANFLIHNNVNFIYEAKICNERRWKCDFLVNDLYIELDGLGKFRVDTGKVNLNSYLEKLQYYKDNNIKHLILYRSGWKEKLQEALGI